MFTHLEVFLKLFEEVSKNELVIRKLRPNHRHDKSDSILIDSDNVSLMTKLTLRPEINALRFDEKSFFNTILGFSPHWD